MKDEFLKIYTENIKRPGADKLLNWLQLSDFFTAPASTKYHSAHEGGLCEHSVKVYNRFQCDDPETRAVCALLHDVCKANVYVPDTRNVKNAQGVWEKVPCYSYSDKLPYGHGEKSVWIVSAFVRLSREETMAIRWHMGETEGKSTAAQAFKLFPLALHLHIADMQATFLDEQSDN